MIKELRLSKASIFGIIISNLVCLIFFTILPDSVSDLHAINYNIDLLYLCISLNVMFFYMGQTKDDIFSPLPVFSFIYLAMFFVTPIYDILASETSWWGFDFFDQGIKASTIALFGYLVFVFLYSFNGLKKKAPLPQNQINKNYKVNNNMTIFIVMGYIISFLINFYFIQKTSGFNLSYILTLGIVGKTNLQSINSATNLDSLSMIIYFLPSFTLLYIEYGKSRILKILFFVVMSMLQVAKGFRFVIFQIILMFTAYYFIRNKKKFNLKIIVPIVVVSLIPIVLMTLFRQDVRSGNGINLDGISMSTIQKALDEAFWDNLRIYKNFYAMLEVVPYKTSYLFGRQMIVYTLIMMIPRYFWPGKPYNPGMLPLELSMGRYVVEAGQAYPNIAEYYYEFGTLGVLLVMGLLGWFYSYYQYKNRFCSSSPIDIMKYCTVLGTILQIIIRGYTPSNFWLVIFCLIPYWLVEFIFKERSRYEEVS